MSVYQENVANRPTSFVKDKCNDYLKNDFLFKKSSDVRRGLSFFKKKLLNKNWEWVPMKIFNSSIRNVKYQ
jgi:hypothetical protein